MGDAVYNADDAELSPVIKNDNDYSIVNSRRTEGESASGSEGSREKEPNPGAIGLRDGLEEGYAKKVVLEDGTVVHPIVVLLSRDEAELPSDSVVSKKASRTTRQKKPPEDDEDSISSLSPKKRRIPKTVICATCENEIIPGQSALPENSLYCSFACIRGMVEKCQPCVKKDEKINFIDEQGTLINLPDFQTVFLPTLEEFLIRKPSCKPFVDFARILAMDESKSVKYFEDTKELKKEDTIRANVKKTILDQLMIRAKKNKVGISRKATLDLSEQIEVELHRIHKSAKNPKYKQWCADFFSQVANESNMFFKSVVSNVYTAKKLVLMKKEEMFIESVPDQIPTPPAPKPTLNLPKKQIMSAVDMILGEEGMDTTTKHNSHEFDSNCQICVAKVREKQAMMELMARDREELLQDRKRRKELGKCRKISMKNDPSDVPSSSKKLKRSPIPTVDPVDEISERSFCSSRNYSPRGYSKSKQITPPPGVSPDRFAVRRISPLGRKVSPQAKWEKPIDKPVGYDEITRMKNERYTVKTDFGTRDGDLKDSWRRLDQRKQMNNNIFSRRQSDFEGLYRHPLESPPLELAPSPMSPRVFEFDKSLKNVDYGQSSKKREYSTPLRNLDLDYKPKEPSPRPEVVSIWATTSSTIWTGQLVGEGFDLKASLKAISNPASFDLKGKLPPVLPIKARVRMEAMWKFIAEIKPQKKYQTLLYLLDPDDGYLEEFRKCYADFERSKRYFVLEFPQILSVKEAYMFNIEPYESLPNVFSPIDGPGLPSTEMGKKLICIVVIRRCEIKQIDESPAMSQSSFNSTTFLKGVQEFMANHKLNPEEKTIVENACKTKIQKQKKQNISSKLPPPPLPPENRIVEEGEVTLDVEMKEVQDLSQEDILMKDKSPKIDDDDDADNKMEIVEPSDEEDERNSIEKMNNPSTENSTEAGDSLISTQFILPPPPPPPTMDLPPVRADPYYSPMPIQNQPNGSAKFFNDLEDGELHSASPPSLSMNIPRGRGKKKNQRRRGNLGNFGPSPMRFPISPQGFFSSSQPPRIFPRFGPRSLPPQEVTFSQRQNFGRPSRPMRMPMTRGPPRGLPPRGFRGSRMRFPPQF